MIISIYRRVFVVIILQALLIIGVAVTGQAIANGASEPKTLDRDLEPVVVKGSKIVSLIGTPVEHLFVYTYTGSAWGGQIPFQVDEITSSGDYATTEDGLLDANDEIAFMVKDLGDRAPDTEPLTATLTISDTWYEIQVTDPLNPNKKGWAYVVRSSALSPTFSDDYVDYTAATQRIATDHYELGFATAAPSPYFGLNYLALQGSGIDILDRTKLRVGVSVFGILATFTEEDLTNPNTVLIKDGPVRALVRQTANASIAGQQETIYKAYVQMLQGVANVDFSGAGVSVSSARTSIDLVSTVPSTTIFYNANTALAGVTVDGTPDNVPATPLSTWTQVSHLSGRFIQVAAPSPAGGTATSFYRDNSTPESDDTGEPGSYGDSGFLVTGGLNSAFSIESSLFFLPPGGGGPDNVGDQYGDFFANTLTVSARSMSGDGTVFLPIVIKNN